MEERKEASLSYSSYGVSPAQVTGPVSEGEDPAAPGSVKVLQQLKSIFLIPTCTIPIPARYHIMSGATSRYRSRICP